MSRRGRPRHRPDKLHADKVYDVRALRAEVRRRGIAVRIARKGIESSTRLGRHRWIIESCLSWLTRNRRLVRRYDRKAEHFQGFVDIACARRITNTEMANRCSAATASVYRGSAMSAVTVKKTQRLDRESSLPEP